jgi:D-alanyl-D-alanine carboxypeptidase/D-alanyl-D-alanine-endopeptidase (penicillin-binding protein 4)
MLQNKRVIGILFLLCLASCTTGPQRIFQAFVNSPPLEGALTGFVVKSLTDNRDLYAVNETKFFIPASNMKLFTTAVALVRLGPEFRYTTPVYTDGVLHDGTLYGNLFVKGVGDPTLSGRFHASGAGQIFEEWADALLRLGIRRITGDIVGDGSLFDDQYMGAGWAWDDEIHCYSAQISALSFNDNSVKLVISPAGEMGSPSVIETGPRTAYVTVANDVTTVSSAEEISITFARAAGANVIKAAGRIGAGSAPNEACVTVHKPSLFAVTVFKEVLESKGIEVEKGVVAISKSDQTPDYESMRIVASYDSPPLREIIKYVNKPSHNLSAELLFRTLGSMFGGEGSTDRSVRVMKEAISEMGILPDQLSIHDGSGLSRYDMVMPGHVMKLLEYMYAHPYFIYFYDSLPLAGVEGTVKRRMKDTEAERKVRAKTGSFKHVLNLSGYITTRKGKMLAFSIMNNNVVGSVSELKKLQDGICATLWRLY